MPAAQASVAQHNASACLSGSESMMVIWVTGWSSVCELALKSEVKHLTLQGWVIIGIDRSPPL
jgi:hypothetical protein